MRWIAKECIIKKALMWRTLLDVVYQLHIYKLQRVLLGFVNLLLDITTNKHERALLLRFLRFPSSASTATCLGQRRPVQAYMKQLKLALLYFYVCCLHTEPVETSQWQAPRISLWVYLSNEQRGTAQELLIFFRAKPSGQSLFHTKDRGNTWGHEQAAATFLASHAEPRIAVDADESQVP